MSPFAELAVVAAGLLLVVREALTPRVYRSSSGQPVHVRLLPARPYDWSTDWRVDG